jgi:hypothetical protein
LHLGKVYFGPPSACLLDLMKEKGTYLNPVEGITLQLKKPLLDIVA